MVIGCIVYGNQAAYADVGASTSRGTIVGWNRGLFLALSLRRNQLSNYTSCVFGSKYCHNGELCYASAVKHSSIANGRDTGKYARISYDTRECHPLPFT